MGTYTLTVTDSKNCTKTGSVFVNCITGIFNTTADNTINLYPNPVKNTLILETENSEKTRIEVLITTIEGKEVKREVYKDNPKGKIIKEIDMNGLADQIYFVRVKINERAYMKRISKIK